MTWTDTDTYRSFHQIVAGHAARWPDRVYVHCIDQDKSLTYGQLYGLSNHLINTDWPKIVRGKRQLTEILTRQASWGAEELFGLLSDRVVAPDDQLPDTGVELQWERLLSPLFITSPNYGTRSSSILLITNAGEVTFEERTFGPNPPIGSNGSRRKIQFTIDPPCR